MRMKAGEVLCRNCWRSWAARRWPSRHNRANERGDKGEGHDANQSTRWRAPRPQPRHAMGPEPPALSSTRGYLIPALADQAIAVQVQQRRGSFTKDSRRRQFTPRASTPTTARSARRARRTTRHLTRSSAGSRETRRGLEGATPPVCKQFVRAQVQASGQEKREHGEHRRRRADERSALALHHSSQTRCAIASVAPAPRAAPVRATAQCRGSRRPMPYLPLRFRFPTRKKGGASRRQRRDVRAPPRARASSSDRADEQQRGSGAVRRGASVRSAASSR